MPVPAFLILTFFKLLKIGTGFYRKGVIAAAISQVRIAIAGVLRAGRLKLYLGGVYGRKGVSAILGVFMPEPKARGGL